MLVLKENVILNEKETKVISAVLSELFMGCHASELTNLLGSLVVEEAGTLDYMFHYIDFYRRNGIIEARTLTDDEALDDYYYRYEA